MKQKINHLENERILQLKDNLYLQKKLDEALQTIVALVIRLQKTN